MENLRYKVKTFRTHNNDACFQNADDSLNDEVVSAPSFVTDFPRPCFSCHKPIGVGEECTVWLTTAERAILLEPERPIAVAPLMAIAAACVLICIIAVVVLVVFGWG